MKFLIDAQLPKRLARRLCELGHDAIHTLDLPARNRTSDQVVAGISTSEKRITVTKDRDFVDSFILRREPPQLLWLTTGNMSNDELLALFASHLPQLEAAFQSGSFVEFSRQSLIVHE